MQFASTGGIFLRLDSSGNLNVYDTSGNTIAEFVSGAFYGKVNFGTNTLNGLITTTTSASDVSIGYGDIITTKISGRVQILKTLVLNSNTANTVANLSIYYNYGGTTIPAGGAATVGTKGLSVAIQTPATAGNFIAVPLNWTLNTTNGQSTAIYVALSGGNGSTVNVGCLTLSQIPFTYEL